MSSYGRRTSRFDCMTKEPPPSRDLITRGGVYDRHRRDNSPSSSSSSNRPQPPPSRHSRDDEQRRSNSGGRFDQRQPFNQHRTSSPPPFHHHSTPSSSVNLRRTHSPQFNGQNSNGGGYFGAGGGESGDFHHQQDQQHNMNQFFRDNNRDSSSSPLDAYSRDRYSVFNRLGNENSNISFEPPPSNIKIYNYRNTRGGESHQRRQEDEQEQEEQEKHHQIDISSELPEFDPEHNNNKLTARQWFYILENLAEKYSWSVDEKKFWFANKLTGSGKNFLNFSKKGLQENWENIRESFFRTYRSDLDYYELLSEMMAIVQREDEDILSYFNTKLTAIKACDINGAKAVSLIIAGLGSKELRIKIQKNNTNFTSPEELFTFFSVQNKSQQQQQQQHQVQNQQPVQLNTNFNHPPPQIQSQSQGQGQQNQEISCCKICGSFDHNYQVCITRKHLLTRDKNYLYRQDEISSSLTNPKFIVSVFINRTHVKGYVDMDSEQVTIRAATAKLFGLTWTNTHGKAFRSFGKKLVCTKGEVEIMIRIQNVAAKITAYVVHDRDQAFPIMIGRSYITNTNIGYEVYDNKVEFFEMNKMPPPVNVPHNNHSSTSSTSNSASGTASTLRNKSSRSSPATSLAVLSTSSKKFRRDDERKGRRSRERPSTHYSKSNKPPGRR